jgi:hypothetical protein
MAGDVAVVVAISSSHEGGGEWVSGAPGVDGASVWSVPRSRGRSLARGWLVVKYQVWRGFFREKSQRFGANDGDACRRRDPLGGVVVVILSASGLRMKTLDVVLTTMTLVAS